MKRGREEGKRNRIRRYPREIRVGERKRKRMLKADKDWAAVHLGKDI